MKKIILSLIAGLAIVLTSFAQKSSFSLGEKHNQLVQFLDAYDFTGKSQEEAMDDLFFYGGSIIDPAAFPDGRFGIWGTLVACGQADPNDLNRMQTFEGVTSLLEERNQIGAASGIFLNALLTETEHLSDYATVSGRINDLEKGYDIAALPPEEQALVTGALSVFKESALYWNSHYGPDEETAGTNERISWRCFWCVARNDLKGSLIGFAVGNCLCAKVGVANPAVCGAIGAAVIGALYSWAAKVCPAICRSCKKPPANSYPEWICRLPF